MTKLDDILDVDLLKHHINNRLVGVQTHPSLPLLIYNYSAKAQFAGQWGDGTIDLCRGLIVDRDNNIVARPFKKFHNIDTPSIPETTAENIAVHFHGHAPVVTEKMDGSLGILYRYNDNWGIATRGSFTSQQAQWATRWYADKIAKNELALFNTTEFTPLFEIVYPDNRIVVKYDFEGLILLGMVNNHVGYEQDMEVVQYIGQQRGFTGNHIVKCYGKQTKTGILDKRLPDDEKNREGYVLTFDKGENEPPLKVKIKFNDYCRLHKVVTGVSPKGVWELLSLGQDVTFVDDMPEHFIKWATQWIEELRYQYNWIDARAEIIFSNRPTYNRENPTHEERRDVASYFIDATKNEPELRGILFMMLDEVPEEQISAAIWKLVKPRGDDKSFRQDGE